MSCMSHFLDTLVVHFYLLLSVSVNLGVFLSICLCLFCNSLSVNISASVYSAYLILFIAISVCQIFTYFVSCQLMAFSVYSRISLSMSVYRLFLVILGFQDHCALWAMPDTNPGSLPQKSGALPMSHHIYLHHLLLSFCLLSSFTHK